MAYNNAASVYGNARIQTATQAELVLMLYEGVIKFSNLAIMAIEKNNIEKANTNIKKAKNIILELESTLDHKYEISKDFDIIYDYIDRRLTQANIKKDKEILEEVLVHLRTVRDTWKEVMKRTGGQKPTLVLDTN